MDAISDDKLYVSGSSIVICIVFVFELKRL